MISTLSIVLFLTALSSANICQPVKYREVNLKVYNALGVDVVSTVITDIDPFDFPDLGPLVHFQNLDIPSGQTVYRRIKMNYDAPFAPLTMTVVYSSGNKDTFRVNLRHALGDVESGLRPIQKYLLVVADNEVYLGLPTLKLSLTVG